MCVCVCVCIYIYLDGSASYTNTKRLFGIFYVYNDI